MCVVNSSYGLDFLGGIFRENNQKQPQRVFVELSLQGMRLQGMRSPSFHVSSFTLSLKEQNLAVLKREPGCLAEGKAKVSLLQGQDCANALCKVMGREGLERN